MTTIRTLWLILGYAGLGLALVVGNRMSVVAPGLPKQDHSKRENVKIGKLDGLSNELSPAEAAIAAGDAPSLHLRAHQYGGSRRDATMRDWLVYDGPPVMIDATGRSATGLNEVGEEEALFERLGPPSLGATLSREPALPFLFDDESASFFNGQRQRARKRPGGGGGGGGGGFKHAKKVVGLPPLLYGGTEEETPPGSRRSDLDELFGQRAFENAGGLPFEPPDPSRKPQGGGIGLSPLIFDADKPPGKRNQAGGGRSAGGGSASQQSPPSSPASAPGGAAIASQFMLRSARGNRQYDVPQIECPSSEDGMERFACPTPDRMGRYRCIDDHVLCDGFIDCPTGEDEDRQACMFYKTTKAHLDVLADALLRWARGR